MGSLHWETFWWLAWIFVVFLPVELYAAKKKAPGDTFSENVWDWFGVKTPKRFGTLRRLILAAFLASLSIHFLFATTVVFVAIFGGLVGLTITYSLFFDARS